MSTVVGTGSRRFVPKTVTKAIYATRREGAIIVEATSAGIQETLTTEQAQAAHRLNVNAATFEELMTLPQIGKVKAIVNYRKANGKFQSVDVLNDVRASALRRFVRFGMCVSPSTRAAAAKLRRQRSKGCGARKG